MTNKYMYFVANWKMFGDLRTLNSLDKVIKFSKNNKKNKLKIVYCPPNTLIRPLSRRLKKTKIEVGAQNCHHSYDYGAHTCLLYTSPSPRDAHESRMPSSA